MAADSIELEKRRPGRAAGVAVAALAIGLGFVGLSLLFSDLGPGESGLGRILLTGAFFFFSGLVIGYVAPRRWWLAGLTAWGGVLLGAAGLVSGGPRTDAVAVVQAVVVEGELGLGPATVPAGELVIQQINQGTTLHELALFELASDAVLADAVSAADGLGEPLIRLVPVEPGLSSSALFRGLLRPGRYAIACIQTHADGTPHYVRGEAAQLDVE